MQNTNEQRDILVDWLERNLIPRKSINNEVDTSCIRLAFEHDTKIYVDNDTVNDITLALGYHAANFANDPYLVFNVSAQSPALQIYWNEVLGPH